jgi:hypothetical protein
VFERLSPPRAWFKSYNQFKIRYHRVIELKYLAFHDNVQDQKKKIYWKFLKPLPKCFVMAFAVSMLVYMETASAVKSLACGGNGPRSLMSFRTAKESLRYILENIGRSFFIWWLSHLEKILAKLPTQRIQPVVWTMGFYALLE